MAFSPITLVMGQVVRSTWLKSWRLETLLIAATKSQLNSSLFGRRRSNQTWRRRRKEEGGGGSSLRRRRRRRRRRGICSAFDWRRSIFCYLIHSNSAGESCDSRNRMRNDNFDDNTTARFSLFYRSFRGEIASNGDLVPPFFGVGFHWFVCFHCGR